MTYRGCAAVSVRWRHAGDVNGWTPLLPAPDTNPGFVEACSYRFERPGAGWSFCVDDESLPDDGSCWVWEPGFYAGEVTAELLNSAGLRSGLFLLDVSPAPGKLGRETFARMLRELWAEDPALVIGSEPATIQMGELGSIEDPWASFARLRQHAAAYTTALAGVCAHPRRTLRAHRDSSPLHRVRRIDRRTVQAVVRSPAVALFVPSTEEIHGVPHHVRLDVPVVEESLDSAANRAMLALLLAVLRRSRTLLQALQHAVSRARDSETRTSLERRWPVRRQFLVTLIERLQRVARRHPFADVSRAEITAAGLNAVSADPLYSRAWTTGWRAIRQGIESGTSADRLWISPSWEIYERWCFLRVGQLLHEYAPAWQWQRLRNPHRWAGALDGRRASVELQPVFPASGVARTGRWSVSKQREPDIVVSVEEPDDSIRFVVLDAKYRASRANVLDAMTSAHVYQDSLRIGVQRPEASLLLVPSGGGATWLEDEAFQAEHRVGIHSLSPADASPLPYPVNALLSSAACDSAIRSLPPQAT